MKMKLSKDDLDTLESKFTFLIIDREPIRADWGQDVEDAWLGQICHKATASGGHPEHEE